MLKQTFKVLDMTCSNCALKLETLEDTLAGVQRIDASYHKLEMTIEYDETQLSVQEIIAAVQRSGYTAALANPPK
ncbi:MAG: heavy-metal-associated domain-containing protein [Anaerolineales bacterium]|nr:heavy-metal-associated domain-containing protein [Anaerolineales bacterium]